jgi:iron complex outermembrane receptor protein
MHMLGWVGRLLAAALLLAPPAIAQTTEEITVTARKRDESTLDVPISVTAFSAEQLRDHDIRDFTDYGTKVPGLAFAYGNGSTAIATARTVSIRGISGAGTTGFYIDDTPVPASLDPRVVEIDRIEVLKGPQGTLFGESSLGGNVRLLTMKPDLDQDSGHVETEAGLTAHGGAPDGGAELAGNAVILPGRLALRASGFADNDAGYLTRTYPDDTGRASIGNQGDQFSFGGTVAALLRVSDQIDLSFRLMGQNSHDNGFPATFAPLPGFVPQYTLDRAADIQPTVDDTWWLPSAQLDWRGDGWSLVSSTSWFFRHAHDYEDSTEGTTQIDQLFGLSLPAQPFAWTADRPLRQVSHETRLSWEPVWGLSGTVGVFYSLAHQGFDIPPIYGAGLAQSGAWPNNLLWQSSLPTTDQDVALFGELYYRFLDRFTLTLGARQYWLNQRASFHVDGFQNGGLTEAPDSTSREAGISPKFALDYRLGDAASLYASASEGFRAGGAQLAPISLCDPLPFGLSAADFAHFKSDTVWSYEAGTKGQLADPGLLLTASGYHIDWSDIQQQIYLPNCGFLFQGNAGAAAINGGELELSGHILPPLELSLGLGYTDATITKQGETGQPVGSRVYQVPKWSATTGVTWRQELTDEITGFVSADLSYVGDSISANSFPGLNLTRPAYTLADVRLGVEWGKSELALALHNLTDAKPNLGDLSYIGYEAHEGSFAGPPIPQVATLQPFTVVLQYRRAF